MQVPRDDVRKVEAEGNVRYVHVAGAAVVGSEQDRSTVQLRSGILCGDSGAWPVGRSKSVGVFLLYKLAVG